MAVEVLLIIQAAQGMEDEMEEALLKLAEEVKDQEPNTMVFKPYKATRHVGGCHRYCVYEKFRDEKSLEAHRNSQSYRDWIAEADRKKAFAAPPLHRRLDPIEEEGEENMLFWRNLGHDDWKYLWGRSDEDRPMPDQ